MLHEPETLEQNVAQPPSAVLEDLKGKALDLGFYFAVEEETLQNVARIALILSSMLDLRHFLLHLALALNVDIEQHIVSAPRGLVQHHPGCPVIVVEDLGVLQELITGQHLFKLRPGDEVILAAILLAAARRARGKGDRELQVGDELAHLFHLRVFPRARWRRNDVNTYS